MIMLARLFISFCMIFSSRSPKDGLSNLGSILCGIGAIGGYLYTKDMVSEQYASHLAALAFIGGGLIGWATSKPDDLGL